MCVSNASFSFCGQVMKTSTSAQFSRKQEQAFKLQRHIADGEARLARRDEEAASGEAEPEAAEAPETAV